MAQVSTDAPQRRSGGEVPVRWGVLSTALINDKVLTAARLSDAVDVVAIASRDGGRATEVATRWGIDRSYGEYDALLADEDVEAVYVPLPNGMHHGWTLRALAAGKHVLCKKPYSRHPEEVMEAFDFADRAGLVLSEAFMYRYHPQIAALQRMVREEERIGELRLISAAFSWPACARDDIRFDAALDGGSLMDVGVYCINAARMLAGEPISVAAQQVVGPTGVDESFAAVMAFDDAVSAHFDCGFGIPNRSYLEVVGTEGTIQVSDPWHGLEPGLQVRVGGQVPEFVHIPLANSYQLELEEFARAVRTQPNTRAVRNRPHALLGRADAHGQAVALEALYESANLGKSVSIPTTRFPLG